MFSKATFTKDLSASFVVFLIALPICLGISIASGVDPLKGIFTGIIGGLVVGIFSGSPLQISGPSTGLAVMVLHVVDVYGVLALIPLGIVVGLFQIATALFKVAHFFQATPPALLKSMLSGIGGLIVMGQIYIIFGMKMSSSGIDNILGLPGVFFQVVSGELSAVQTHSGLLALMVVILLFLWNMGKSKIFEAVPGPLVAIVSASAFVYFTGWEMSMVHLPNDLFQEALNLDYAKAFSSVDLSFYPYAVGFAFVASAETLLCVGAVDKMSKTSSNYNKQITAQGIGNIVAGLLGCIPVVGVISRTAANVEFGAKTQLSSILLGLWIALALLIPSVINLIPIPALAGLLVFIGLKLLDLKSITYYVRKYNKTSLIFFTCLGLTLTVDLLAGVLAGFGVSILILVYDVLKFDLEVEEVGQNKRLKFKGKLSFLDLPVLSQQLKEHDLDEYDNLEICLREVEYLDPAITEHLSDLKDKLESQGKNIEIRYSKIKMH